MGIDVLSASPDKKGYWVVFADDADLAEFKRKLSEYGEGRYPFFNAIDGLEEIPPGSKIGPRLSREPIQGESRAFIDVEIWRLESGRLQIFINNLRRLIQERGGEVTQDLVTRSFCLLKVSATAQLLRDLVELPEVAWVDRPPRVRIDVELGMDLEALEIGGHPLADAPGVIVVDSGVRAGHPLLAPAVADEFVLTQGPPPDGREHGTTVGGFAVYGDIRECIERREFLPSVWLFSAKVMNENQAGEAVVPDRVLLEAQVRDSIISLTQAHANCRVVNVSIGDPDKRMFPGRRQGNFAALLDELALEQRILVVVSTGNLDDADYDNYPDYFFQNTDHARIVDPAPAALALTVGGVAPCRVSSPLHHQVGELFPSRITRVGPGLRGAIKPDLVEQSGGGFGADTDLAAINPRWIEQSRLFQLTRGTSFSAPRVAHYAARLFDAYPNASPNLVRALLVASAAIPDVRPGRLAEIDSEGSNTDVLSLLSVYGYGKPNFSLALRSRERWVLFMKEDALGLDKVRVYSIAVPETFIENRGRRGINVSLAYDPPVNKNRADYLGNVMEFHLFRNIPSEDVLRAYGQSVADEDAEELVPASIRSDEIKMAPGTRLRSLSATQKAWKYYKRKPDIEHRLPMSLVVICRDKWIADEDFAQSFAVAVTLEHENVASLHAELSALNRVRLLAPRLRLPVRVR